MVESASFEFSNAETEFEQQAAEVKPHGPQPPSEGEGLQSVPAEATPDVRTATDESSSAPSQAAEAENDLDLNGDFDAGMLWIVKNNKMIVSGFVPGSMAPNKGVQPGDILRAIDKKDILKLGVDE
eukprot:CAMPEP_0202830626 /NCGR_PEP_ID=MMETSP1389-20130828/16299_1 /ASSEMBLY_ACC=CAM_ASM_000865 /TAXON_ID=302021 /ORGANISM="Rhodomonas sp., Strain CCMP768" /LENGTH=125 /DNA_ID=CAMNT_0049504283 /DNA_START=18 /DNA_END=392 /DNA_ORIENTATION=+